MKAKCKILYMEGETNVTKPGTFFVCLHRWVCEEIETTHYVLETELVTKEFSETVRVAIDESWDAYVVEFDNSILQTNDDGEAIREAVAKYYELIEKSKEIKNESE